MSASQNSTLPLDQALEKARRDLLDLGLRNPLLNHQTPRARGVDVIDADAVEVFQILIREESSMSFRPGSETSGSGDLLLELTQPEGNSSPENAADRCLQTGYTSAQLQKRLLATDHSARTSIAEQGVNTLYLALGMLHWYENEASDKPHRAPLILIPAKLERSNSRDRFHMTYSGGEVEANVSLVEKLKVEFGIKNFPNLPDAETLDVKSYFEKVETLIHGRPRWAVERNSITLGFFSFAKLLMYKDLDPQTWKAASSNGALHDHEILQALLGDAGFATQASNYREDQLLDDQLGDLKPVQIVDADSSQTIATLDALEGRNMVIQGPPGTGKSQTILNLIAGAVATGKSVLFVAEKMAALNVVKRRLDSVGLGRLCLVLHDNAQNKKSHSLKRQVIDDLKATVGSAQNSIASISTYADQLERTRQQLNKYCTAVNAPIGATGETPCSAYGRLLEAEEALKDLEPRPALDLDAALWSVEESARRSQLVSRLQSRLAKCGVPSKHPFGGSQRTLLLGTDKDAIASSIDQAWRGVKDLEAACEHLCATCGVPRVQDCGGANVLAKTAELLVRAPELGDCDRTHDGWLLHSSEVTKTIEAGRRLQALRDEYRGALRNEAWAMDVLELRRVVRALGPQWWRFLSGRWRAAKAEFVSLCADTPKLDLPSILERLDAIVEASECSKLIAASTGMMQPLFRSNWRDQSSDWSRLEQQSDWIQEAHRGIRAGDLARWGLEVGAMRAKKDLLALNDAVKRVCDAILHFKDAVRSWSDVLAYIPSGGSPPLQSRPFTEVASLALAQQSNLEQLQALIDYNQVAVECEKDGLASVTKVAREWDHAAKALVPLFERVRVSSILGAAFRERPVLAGFNGSDHSSVVGEFRRLDRIHLESNRACLAAQHAKALPPRSGIGAMGTLCREFEKDKKLLPIRELVDKAGTAIQRIKPVFMMSPLSIANYIPPGSVTFDLVIFDEASQVKPVDALGAVIRGKQVVVVGDSKQLPPTSFFDAIINQEESDDEDQAATSDIESILGLLSSRGAHQRMLRWHYRSKHESLIAISNHLFYDDGLVVFPSPSRDRDGLGLVYHRLKGAFYDRSKTRTNLVEAKAVAKAVMQHARAQMKLPASERDTLLVVAFSVAQKDAIFDQVELMRKEDPTCEEFFAGSPHEPFDVKNLETVQGDERDVIYISIGYSRTVEGYLHLQFGPLNRDGGERRLNVLISRARKRCEVFTGLGSEDIDISKNPASGVVALKKFLYYAESGILETPVVSGKAPDSEFEEQVLKRLTALGHVVHAQVGCAGFFIDLAVVDQEYPGRYLLGIECDGARYHSARSARDRDRLRQSVLERLGWRIFRVWSTDWFRDADAELRRLVEAIEAARLAKPGVQVERLEEPEQLLQSADSMEPAAPAIEMEGPEVTAYVCADVEVRLGGRGLHEVGRQRLAEYVAEVVAVESPVHQGEAVRRVLRGAGVQRLGNRIEAAFAEALEVGVGNGLFRRVGEFLWSVDSGTPVVRDRSSLSAALRKIELVDPAEIREAILLVIRESCGISTGEVPAAVSRKLGFPTTTEEIRRSVIAQQEYLLEEGRIRLSGLNLVI